MIELVLVITLSIIVPITIILLCCWIYIEIEDFLNRYDEKDLVSIDKREKKLIRQYDRISFESMSMADCKRMDEIKAQIEILKAQRNRLIKENRSGKTAMELVYERMDEVESRFIVKCGDQLESKRGCDYLRLERICVEEGTSLAEFLEFYHIEKLPF